MNEPKDIVAATAAIAEFNKAKGVKKGRKPRKLLKSEEWAAAVKKGQDSIATIRALLEGTLTEEFTALLAVFEDLRVHERQPGKGEKRLIVELHSGFGNMRIVPRSSNVIYITTDRE